MLADDPTRADHPSEQTYAQYVVFITIYYRYYHYGADIQILK